MSKTKSRRTITLWVVMLSLVGLGGFAASTAAPAHAAQVLMQTISLKNDNPPAPTCAGAYVFSGKKVGCVPCPPGTKKDDATQKCKVVAAPPAAGGADVEVDDSGVDSFHLYMRGTIVADVHLKGTKKNSPKCGVSAGWNGYKVVNGRWEYRWETNVQYCPNSNSPTGYAKVGGGDTGKDCENPFKPGHVKAPGPKLVGPITELNSFNVNIPVTANAHASVHGQCPNIDVGGSASASGLVKATITQDLIMRAKGKVSALSALLKESLIGQGVTKATAKLHLKCNVPPPTTVTSPTQTVTTPTQTVTTPATTTTTTTTTTTPAPTLPSCNNVTTPENGTNGIYADGETYPGTVNVYGQRGDTFKLTFAANPGSGSITSTNPLTSSGSDTANWTYKAPNDSSTVGKYDQITITVTDTTISKSATCTSGQFLISAVPNGGTRP